MNVDRGMGKITVNDGGMSYGYGSFLRYIGADQGDLLLAEFDLSKSNVLLSINDNRTFEEA